MLAGLVEVDGEVVTRLGTKVDPRTAVIRVDGKRLPPVSAARLPRAQQAARASSRRCPTRRAGGRWPTCWPTGRSGSSTSAGSTPTPRG